MKGDRPKKKKNPEKRVFTLSRYLRAKNIEGSTTPFHFILVLNIFENDKNPNVFPAPIFNILNLPL